MDIKSSISEAGFSAADSSKGNHQITGFNHLLGGLGVLLLRAVIGGAYFYLNNRSSLQTASAGAKKSIAVLPFRQIDEGKDAKLGPGIADVLIATLGNTKEVDVRPTTPIVRFSSDDHTDLLKLPLI